MDYQIETEFQGPGFVAVPNHVANGTLSSDALGVLVYLASLPRGFVLRVATVQERFSFGKDKWQRIAKELRDAGAMEVDIIRAAGGRAVGKRVKVKWPANRKPENPALGHRKLEKPTVGKSAKRSRKTRQSAPENPALYKYKDKKGVEPSVPESRGPENQALGVRVPVSRPLTRFERDEVLAGRSVVVDQRLIEAGSPDHESLSLSLR